MTTPSSTIPEDSPQIVGPLLIALVQTSSIIFLGYLCMALGAISYLELTGIKKFCGRIALPAIFFLEVANIDWSTVEFRILLGMFSAKLLVFSVTAIYVCMRQAWHSSSTKNQSSSDSTTSTTTSSSSSKEGNILSTMGIFCIFATKSNDIALGVPLINAAFSGPNTTQFSKYLYLFAPFQLLILNVTGFVLLEIGRHRQQEIDEKKQRGTTFLRNLSTDDDTEISSESEQGAARPNTTTTTPSTTSVLLLLPRVLWNVMTTPPVLSVIMGLITNLALTMFLPEAVKASRSTLLPSSVNLCLSTVGNGYAVSALFSIGAGMYGCFGRSKFGTKEILDGIVLIFMKTLFMAFVTNRMIALFMAPYATTQPKFFADSADFGWLYGMTPVAPTVYMFAELYQIHIDFMALFANVCMLVAGPMMVVSGAALEGVKGLTFARYMLLHDLVAGSLAWIGIAMCVPLLFGMMTSRWFLKFPCDFITILLMAFLGYSVMTVDCIKRSDASTNTIGPHNTSGSPSSSMPIMQNTFPAFFAFFCETLYQTEAAGLCVYLALKRKNKHNGRLRVFIHSGSLLLSGAVTLLIWWNHLPQVLSVNSQRCAMEFIWRGVHGVGENQVIVWVGSFYQCITFFVSGVGLYKFHEQRSRSKIKANNKAGGTRQGSGGMSTIDEHIFGGNDTNTALLDDFSSDYGPSPSSSVSMDGTRQESHYGLYPSSQLRQAVTAAAPESTSQGNVYGTGGPSRSRYTRHGASPLHSHSTPGSSRSISTTQRKANALMMLNRSISGVGGGGGGVGGRSNGGGGSGVNGGLFSNNPSSSSSSSSSISSPIRVLAIITFALMSTMARFLTDTVYNFKIASTIEISLLAVVLTYIQGIVVALLYVLHPIVLTRTYDCINYIFMYTQPEDEIEDLEILLKSQHGGIGGSVGIPSSVGVESETDYSFGISQNGSGIFGDDGVVSGGGGSSSSSGMKNNHLKIGGDVEQAMILSSPLSSTSGSTALLSPTLRLAVVDEEKDGFQLDDAQETRSQSYSVPTQNDMNEYANARSVSTARQNYSYDMDVRRRRANIGRLMTFRTRNMDIM